jgi:hypothetical protein
LGWLDCWNGSPKLFYEELTSVHWRSRVVYHRLVPRNKRKKICDQWHCSNERFLRVALVRVYLFRCSMWLQRAFNKNFGLELVHCYPSPILLKDFSQGAPPSIEDKIPAHFLCCLLSLLEKHAYHANIIDFSVKSPCLRASFHPKPLFQWGVQSKEIPLNLGMKCWEVRE